ncbi:MAG: Imm10 family immunity protein [Trebonia sp.]
MQGHGQQGWAPAVVCHVGDYDSDLYVVAIRETDAPGSWSLSFTECRDGDDPQEIRLGMDTYCLVVDPGQATHYGGVRECELDGGRLHLRLTEEAAGSLGMPADVTLALDLTPQQVDLLSRGLARVLTSGRADAIPQRLRV